MFSRPGIGKLVYGGVISRNYSVTMGAVQVTTVPLAISTLIADLIKAELGPPVREGL